MSSAMAWAANMAERRRTIPASVRGHSHRSSASMASWTGSWLGVNAVPAAASSTLSHCSGRMRKRLPIVLSVVSVIEPSDFFAFARLERAFRWPNPASNLHRFTSNSPRLRTISSRPGTARGSLSPWNPAIRPGTERTMQDISVIPVWCLAGRAARPRSQRPDSADGIGGLRVAPIWGDFSRHDRATLGYERSHSSAAHRT